jgi:hypothetical protein
MIGRFFTAASKPVDVDFEKRIVRNAVFATTGLASDGWIIVPSGMDLARYLGNPIVTARHLATLSNATVVVQDEGRPVVVGRSLALQAGDLELVSEVQFADTMLGSEYGYLFGLNPDKFAFMRSWSVEGAILETAVVDWKRAETLAGPYWDANLAERMKAKAQRVNVAVRFELALVAAVPIGADRNALTRAYREGVQTAGAILTELDLHSAMVALDEMRAITQGHAEHLARLEGEITALRGEVASTARQRNVEALHSELQKLLAVARQSGE